MPGSRKRLEAPRGALPNPPAKPASAGSASSHGKVRSRSASSWWSTSKNIVEPAATGRCSQGALHMRACRFRRAFLPTKQRVVIHTRLIGASARSSCGSNARQPIIASTAAVAPTGTGCLLTDTHRAVPSAASGVRLTGWPHTPPRSPWATPEKTAHRPPRCAALQRRRCSREPQPLIHTAAFVPMICVGKLRSRTLCSSPQRTRCQGHRQKRLHAEHSARQRKAAERCQVEPRQVGPVLHHIRHDGRQSKRRVSRRAV